MKKYFVLSLVIFTIFGVLTFPEIHIFKVDRLWLGAFLMIITLMIGVVLEN